LFPFKDTQISFQMPIRFAIIKERKSPPDRRVVLSPQKCQEVIQQFPEAHLKIEKSNIRVFSDEAYKKENLEITNDISDCDVMLGVKEVPVSELIPNKKYFFFSHTLKQQPYNRTLLQAILQKKIELYDHETIVDEMGRRLIGFGRYAGLVGSYNGFRVLGMRDHLFSLPKVETLQDFVEMKEELKRIKLPSIKIILTGKGKVAHGVVEILHHMQIQRVYIEEYLTNDFDKPVYCMIDVLDYNKRIDGKDGNKHEFYNDPSRYESDFMRFARVSDLFITGHYYGDEAPFLFTREDAKHSDFKINLVADISCDIDGPVASTIRPTTVANPYYGYDPITETEVSYNTPGAITVMAVDNLPSALPKDASEGFGDMFLEHVIPAFFNDDKDRVLERARMTTHDGKLTRHFSYLQDYVDENEGANHD